MYDISTAIFKMIFKRRKISNKWQGMIPKLLSQLFGNSSVSNFEPFFVVNFWRILYEMINIILIVTIVFKNWI
ncbi:hypothetical protein PROH_14640 [Prochlorothrix hollandica PCC 9006 = CALU 1027]|uniref:Uncharacterized protein n=1 Tax=Prochlorothrix hollandica PCC 9006 = CALU 1027 TaxID=317619 RepID=A0A0M2PWJ2_PROHO|nr:hypothetical protein PROH_14640 [Prochlorothrix hollandica PCC 9006 = CALU 1027]